jgi:Tol biopolymer transport system component
VRFLGEGVEAHRKAGWIVRNSLESDAPHVNAAVHDDGLTSLQYRQEKGGATLEIPAADSFPEVIRLERRGDRWIFSYARFGEPVKSVVLDSLRLDKEVYAGLYVCSYNAEVVENVLFRNVRITRPAGEGWNYYHDYLGSRLEIMDVATGLRKVIFTSAFSIQAPNWTPDGRYLIFNSKGRLFRYDLQKDRVTPLNTGFADRCNNDHLLTFDGTLLGISTIPPGEKRSAIYYLPATGDSMPVRVTKPGKDASYLHGWAPDNRTMLFTGFRKGHFDIYAVDIFTGQERRLTSQPTLDDGPEYSPDGKYIFFNSARTGTMQIWRMNPDGSNKTQLTFDPWHDWFPHVSPNRQQIVFISFPPAVDAQDHPFYKRCMLRMIPYEGGEPRVIAYIYGGQGTINVPSWSPDSRKIAFVTNTGM